MGMHDKLNAIFAFIGGLFVVIPLALYAITQDVAYAGQAIVNVTTGAVFGAIAAALGGEAFVAWIISIFAGGSNN